MDIFTTQLARVVQTPIKPASLKVKALVKDAGTSKLKEDPDHLENHEYYFKKGDGEDKQRSGEQTKKQQSKENAKEQENKEQHQKEPVLEKLPLTLEKLQLENKALDDTEYCPNGKTDPTPDDEDEHKGKNLDLYA